MPKWLSLPQSQIRHPNTLLYSIRFYVPQDKREISKIILKTIKKDKMKWSSSIKTMAMAWQHRRKGKNIFRIPFFHPLISRFRLQIEFVTHRCTAPPYGNVQLSLHSINMIAWPALLIHNMLYTKAKALIDGWSTHTLLNDRTME